MKLKLKEKLKLKMKLKLQNEIEVEAENEPEASRKCLNLDLDIHSREFPERQQNYLPHFHHSQLWTSWRIFCSYFHRTPFLNVRLKFALSAMENVNLTTGLEDPKQNNPSNF